METGSVLGILLVVIVAVSDGAHRNLLDNYYRKMAYVEKSYLKQNSQGKVFTG